MIRVKDPISGGSHFFGAVLAVIGLILLYRQALHYGTAYHIVTFLIFGISLILLYSASSIHHLIPKPIKHAKLYRRIDHAMIFILIAGTYTPICLVALGGTLGWALISAIWALAVGGAWLKLRGRRVPRRVSTALYVSLGWSAIVAVFPLINELTPKGFLWLLIGGCLYTFGGVIYALKRPNPIRKVFGFHEIFHLFVLGGSLCHFWVILNYVR